MRRKNECLEGVHQAESTRRPSPTRISARIRGSLSLLFFPRTRSPSHDLYEPAGSTKLPDTDISDPEDQEEEDFFAYARQVFDAKEFQRVATILRDCDSPKAVFLRLYARYLESERVAQLQWWKLSSK